MSVNYWGYLICSQIWLAGSCVVENRWPSLAMLILGCVWLISAMMTARRDCGISPEVKQ